MPFLFLYLSRGKVLLNHKRVPVGCQRERERGRRNDPDDEKHVLKLHAGSDYHLMEKKTGCEQSCEMSQIWQIYLCKIIGRLGLKM